MRLIERLDETLPGLNYPVLIGFLALVGVLGLVNELEAERHIEPFRMLGFTGLFVVAVVIAVGRLSTRRSRRSRDL
jgi:hypothetical protein